ncbi:pyridoxamine 5'-phosphate oxidase family protein [Sediminicola sp. 1XM1-17]|uniref:pyridoxamine 5'-phosphate oxidase family protein n=1 Tax=Sediminicola sp. 1XM1-17 TaxID=3127702 RepID=UPI00307701DA
MSIKNLFSTEAKQKIKDLAESIDFNLMAPDLKNIPIHAIPMSTKKVDENGSIWFLSTKDSNHNSNIKKDKNVHLFYANSGAFEFMNIYGHAYILDDRNIIDDLYQKSDDNWFNGKDDPNLTVIRVEPKDAHYWDTKNGMFVSLLKMGVGVLTGKKSDLGIEGELKI